MTPNRGQGAGRTSEGAVALAARLDGASNIPDARKRLPPRPRARRLERILAGGAAGDDRRG